MYRRVSMPSRLAETARSGNLNKVPSGLAKPDADLRDEIEHHLAAMRAFALILARKRAIADDIVTRTVVAAWANIAAFDPGSNMRAWLFRMVRNAYYTERGPRERGTSDDFGAHFGLLKLRSGANGTLSYTRFRRAFNSLADEQREALVLLEAEGFSLEEAATVCGCAPATIKSRAKLARRKLAVHVSLETGDVRTVGDPATLEAICRHALAGPLGMRNRKRLGLANRTRSAGTAHQTRRPPGPATPPG
jgi:RNA polymerase sigma-70 factor, ECF subfamily